MNKNFITVTDIDDRLQTININHISRVAWAEDRDEDGIVDMVYLSEGAECAEIALASQSESSKLLMAGITAGVTNHKKVYEYLNPENKD